MFRLLFWLFILFLALSYFGISIERIIDSPAGQQNLAYVHDLFLLAWQWITTRI